jgi:hypothetical protein
MSKIKHTPGPWAQHDETYCPGEIWGALDMNENGVRGIHICTLEDCVELQANAKLVAAAPELLEALEGLINLDDLQALAASHSVIFRLYRAAQDVILKAKGTPRP